MQLEELIFLRVHANQKVIVIQKGRYTIAIGHLNQLYHGFNYEIEISFKLVHL
jgi:hypothetical protein